jgi:hypothetical protein
MAGPAAPRVPRVLWIRTMSRCLPPSEAAESRPDDGPGGLVWVLVLPVLVALLLLAIGH